MLLSWQSSAAAMLPCWKGRLGWWRDVFFAPAARVGSGAGPAAERAPGYYTTALKAACAHFLYGAACPFRAASITLLEANKQQDMLALLSEYGCFETSE